MILWDGMKHVPQFEALVFEIVWSQLLGHVSKSCHALSSKVEILTGMYVNSNS